MTTTPDQLLTQIDQLEQQTHQAFSALTRPDRRSPVYSADETRAREAAIRTAFHRGVTAIAESISTINAEAEAELDAVSASDPTARFSTAELEAISRRTPIVAEDLAAAPEPVQLARLRAALTAGSAERYIALRAGRALLAERARQRAASVPEYRDGRPVTPPVDRSDVAQAVAALAATFVDQARRERAEAKLAAVGSVSGKLAATRYMLSTYGPLAAGRSLTR